VKKLLLLVVLALFAFGCSGASESSAGWAAKRVGDGVGFKLEPTYEEGKLVFSVRVDTHSGELADLDLKKSALLLIDGRKVAPIEAPRLKGHHAGGRLVFPLDEAPTRFAVELRGVRGKDLKAEWP
jgi:hypothetical protein